jgi:putative transposase
MEALWEEIKDLVTPETGFFIIDDTVLDKPYYKHIDLSIDNGVVNIIRL